jgi:hypothetical protein
MAYLSKLSRPIWNSLCCSSFSIIDPGTRFSHSGKKNFSSLYQRKEGAYRDMMNMSDLAEAEDISSETCNVVVCLWNIRLRVNRIESAEQHILELNEREGRYMCKHHLNLLVIIKLVQISSRKLNQRIWKRKCVPLDLVHFHGGDHFQYSTSDKADRLNTSKPPCCVKSGDVRRAIVPDRLITAPLGFTRRD